MVEHSTDIYLLGNIIIIGSSAHGGPWPS